MPLGSALRRLVARSPAFRGRSTPAERRWARELPGEKYRGAGEMYLRLFVDLAGLTPDDAVLEPGCGTGRMAVPLTGYLSATGSYDGFDVVAEAIERCEQSIAPGHPNFHFRHVDVLNRAYNPKGRLHPAEFEFPYPDEAFDFAFLTSVFTHMLPPEVRHYLRELRRVLRPGGRCMMTFFVLNEGSRDAVSAGRAIRRFAYEGDGYFYDLPEKPEAAVAYREEDILGFLEEARFALHGPIRYGNWTGRRRPGPAPGQDIVVAERD